MSGVAGAQRKRRRTNFHSASIVKQLTCAGAGILAAQFASEALVASCPPCNEGAGNAGCWPQPMAPVRKKSTGKEPQVQPDHPAFPAQWFYGCSALSLVSGLFSHHRLRGVSDRSPTSPIGRLDPSVGRSGPHGLTVRGSAARLAAKRVHRVPSHVW